MASGRLVAHPRAEDDNPRKRAHSSGKIRPIERVTHSASRRVVVPTFTRISSVMRSGCACPYARPRVEPHEPPHTNDRRRDVRGAVRNRRPGCSSCSSTGRSSRRSHAECSAHSCAGQTARLGRPTGRTSAESLVSIPNPDRRARQPLACRRDCRSPPSAEDVRRRRRAPRRRTGVGLRRTAASPPMRRIVRHVVIGFGPHRDELSMSGAMRSRWYY